MKILDVPTASISEVKKSPGKVFERAEQMDNAVYVFNHGDVAGIMLTEKQYEFLAKRAEALEEKLFDMEIAFRLSKTNQKIFTDEKVRGKKLSKVIDFDADDGWE